MPLITIQTSRLVAPDVVQEMLLRVRNGGAEALKCERSNIWVLFDPVQKQYYLQGSDEELLSPDHFSPPVVIIRAQAGRSRVEKESLVRAVAREVSKALSVPFDKVWIHYQEMDPRDVWFGSNLRENL